MTDKEVMHLPQWLQDGKEDPFASYCDRPRDALPLAHWSDDQLANYIFYNYDRSQEDDLAIMLAIANGKETNDVTRIAAATAVQQRLRWLSRRVMLLEGTYPGREAEKPVPTLSEALELTDEERRARQRLEENVPFFYKAFDLNPEHVRMSEVSEIVHAIATDRIYDEEKITSTLRPGRGQAIRAWHQYVQLILTLMRYGKYIPFAGDEIAKAGKNKVFIARSRYHASGQFVNYPAGVVHPLPPVGDKFVLSNEGEMSEQLKTMGTVVKGNPNKPQ